MKFKKKAIAFSSAMGLTAAMGLTQGAFAAVQTTPQADFTYTKIAIVGGASNGIANVISGPYELVSVTVTQTAPDAITTPSGPQPEDQHMLPAAMSFTLIHQGTSSTVTGVMASHVVSTLDPQVPAYMASQPMLTWTTTYAVPVPSVTSRARYTIVAGESGAPVNTMIHYSAGTYSYYNGSTLTVNEWKDTDDPIAGKVTTGFTCNPTSTSTTSPERDNPGVGNQGEPPNNDLGDKGKGNNGDPGYGKGNQKKGYGQTQDGSSSGSQGSGQSGQGHSGSSSGGQWSGQSGQGHSGSSSGGQWSGQSGQGHSGSSSGGQWSGQSGQGH